MISPVRIPADVERPDRVLGPLTARQVAILAGAGLLLYAAWTATRAVVPLLVWVIVAAPAAAVVTVLALGRRDGMGLDRFALAAARYWASPRHRVAGGVCPAPAWLAARATPHDPGGADDPRPGSRTGLLELPATAVHRSTGDVGGSEVGVIDLGGDGLAVIAVASTVNFALRTPEEQDALVGGFARWLHSLAAPVQLLVRTHPLDLTGQIRELRDRAATLPHPALETAAREHADYLTDLARTDLLRRQVLVILREPTPGASAPASPRRPRRAARDTDDGDRRAAEARLGRRLTEAVDLAGPAGIVLTALDAGQATAVLAAACCPGTPLPSTPGMAGADEIITTAPPDLGPDHPAPEWTRTGTRQHENTGPGQTDEDTEAWTRYWPTGAPTDPSGGSVTEWGCGR